MPVDHDRLTELFAEGMDLPAEEQSELIRRVGETDRELARELAAMLQADDSIVTALRTAGLKPDDGGLRMATIPFTMIAIPGYKLRGMLGKGGMGVVYAAEQIDPPRPVAIKVLHMAAAEALARFATEAAIMIKLDHPGIARVLASGEANGHAYIVMERITGVTLDKYLTAQSPSLARKLELYAAICDAVEHAHQQGVTHRDLKPSNIMVRDEGGVAIFDFGIAREASSNRTQQGDFLGTLTYMSPEQALGQRDQIDGRADIYALGVMLHELVRGVLPYDLRALYTAQAVRVIVSQPPVSLGSGIPALDELAAQCLAKQRAARPSSAGDVAARVRLVASGLRPDPAR